jgi:replication-associated recombination protein RarA
MNNFLIATERMDCAKKQPVVLIDEVKRFDRAFACTNVRQPQALVPSAASAR